MIRRGLRSSCSCFFSSFPFAMNGQELAPAVPPAGPVATVSSGLFPRPFLIRRMISCLKELIETHVVKDKQKRARCQVFLCLKSRFKRCRRESEGLLFHRRNSQIFAYFLRQNITDFVMSGNCRLFVQCRIIPP